MKKVIEKETGRELKEGDVVSYSETKFTDHGMSYHKERIIVCDATIEMLLEKGLIEEVKESAKDDRKFEADIIKNIASILDADETYTKTYLKDLARLNEAAFMNVVLKTAQYIIDNNYETVIIKSPTLFGISVYGDVIKFNKETFEYTHRVALFRTEEDAQKALNATDYIYDLVNE